MSNTVAWECSNKRRVRIIHVHITLLLTAVSVPAGLYRAEGMIRNMNTIEDYRGLDMTAILNQAGRTVRPLTLDSHKDILICSQIWEAITDGTIYSCPALLASLTMLCFADLKRYNFTYVCGFPAFHSESPWVVKHGNDGDSDRLASAETMALVDVVQTWRYSVDSRQYGFFLAKRARGISTSIAEGEEDEDTASNAKLAFTWVVDSLSKFEEGFFNGTEESDRFICFADPSTHPQYPAWMLRNLLVLVRKRWKLATAQILCYRDTPARRHEPRSLLLRIETENAAVSDISTAAIPKVTGWEKNATGKITSRITKLGEYLDPQRYVSQFWLLTAY